MDLRKGNKIFPCINDDKKRKATDLEEKRAVSGTEIDKQTINSFISSPYKVIKKYCPPKSNVTGATQTGPFTDAPPTPILFPKKNESSSNDNDLHSKCNPASKHSSHSDVSTHSPILNRSNVFKSFASWTVGDRYRIVRPIGHGSYGEVVEAFDKKLETRVAIKRILNVFEQELDAKRMYREVFILSRLRHSTIIKLLEVILPPDYNDFKDLYLVFEFLDTDLYKLILSPQYLSIPHIKTFVYQLLCGLKYLQSANVIHRDIKPANVLLNEDCTLKICDFGLSRVVEDLKLGNQREKNQNEKDISIRKRRNSGTFLSPETKISRQLTKHVVTRWYRAPELILLQEYGAEVDMWSVGCILAELLSMLPENKISYKDRKPLFPGKSCFPLSADRPTTFSDKLDQLNVIFNVIGTPNENEIDNLGEVRQYLEKIVQIPPQQLDKMFPGATKESIDLLVKMLRFNPKDRISVDDALAHDFLKDIRHEKTEIVMKDPIDSDFEKVASNKDALKRRIYNEILKYQQQSK